MVIPTSAVNASQILGVEQNLTSLASANLASSSLNEGQIGSSDNAVPFSNLIREAVTNAQKLQSEAADTVEGLMKGTGVDVHQAMIATQKADVAFELTLAVRNKAVAAYQQMMNMQF